MAARTHIFDCPSTHEGVREAARSLRACLAESGVEDNQQSEWELVIVEAGNNAVQYSSPESAREGKPIRFVAQASDEWVEVAITDYSRGFEWPEHVSLPEDEAESGRGLYLIASLTDSVRYLRGVDENFLILRRKRPAPITDVQRGSSMEETMNMMTEELANTYESLAAIFKFSAEISDVDNIRHYAAKWMGELLKVSGCTWYVLRQYESTDATLNLVSYGGELTSCCITLLLHGKSRELTCVETAAAMRGADILFDGSSPQQMLTGLMTSFGRPLSGLCHPIFIRKELFGVLTLGSISAASTLSVAQINVIRTFADLLSVQISNLQNHQSALQTLELTRDLQVAANIQRSLLPQTLPQLEGYEIAAHSCSARQVGGDFYDVIAAGPHGVLFAIADVMGKGVPAAMFAAIFRSQLRARPDLLATPGKMMEWLNRVLFADLDNVDMFITAQLAYLDTALRQLTFASAGHCPAMMVSGPGHEIRFLSGEGPPLGINADSFYEDSVSTLAPQSRMLMYTDGLIELRDPSGKALGDEAVASWLVNSSVVCLPASTASASLLDLAGAYCDFQDLNDDITHLMITETVHEFSALEGRLAR